MRIRLKIKHLTLSLIAIGLTVYVLVAIVMPRIELNAARQQFELGSSEGKQGILDAIQHPVSDKSRWDLIREYVIEFGEDKDVMMGFDVYIGPGTSQVNGEVPRLSFSWSEKLELVHDYVANAPADGYVIRAVKQLANYYSGKGQFDEAIEVLVQTATRFKGNRDTWQRKELKLEQGRLLVQHGKDAAAERILENLTNELGVQEFHTKAEIAQLRVKMMIHRGELEQANMSAEQALIDFKEQWQTEKMKHGGDSSGTPLIIEQLEQILEQLRQTELHDKLQVSQVSGTVRRADGTPIPYAGIFLRHESDVNHSVISSEPHQILTDGQGDFIFDNVLPGTYQIFLGLSFDQISGWTWPIMNDQWLDIGENEQIQQEIVLHPLMELKSPVNEAVIDEQDLKFVWSEVEGASYYNVNIGLQLKNSSVGSLLESNILDNHYSITTRQLYDRHMGTSFNEVDGKFVPDPITLLSFASINNRFYWNVEAYDKDDKMITRSNGYRLNDDGIGNLPFFSLKERTMTAADLLLLDGHHDQALAAYKNEYEHNSDDIHSLRMIIRLLESAEEKLPYLQSMVALNPIESYVSDLAHYYYTQHNWSAFVDTYKTNGIDVSSSSSPYTQSVYATVLMKLGRLQEARQQFQQAMDSDLSHRFVGNYIALAVYEDEDLNSALDIAKRYPERMSGGNGTNWYELIVQLENAVEKSAQPKSYMEELNMKLAWIIEGDDKQLERWINSNQTGPKAFIQAIMDVE